MRTLGLAESTPRTEGRLKSLFWPTIQSGADVDYLGAQGFWVCTIFALLAAVSSMFGHPVAGFLSFILYYVSGVGVRERSRFAATIAFLFSVGELVALPSVLKFFFVVLLFSNLRATWKASGWQPTSEQAEIPARLGETWSDKFADRLPSWLWPKVRIPYYIFSVGFTLAFGLGLAAMIARHQWPFIPR